MIKTRLSTKEFFWMAIIFWASIFTAIEAPFSFTFKMSIQNWQIISDALISMLFLIDYFYHRKERKYHRNYKAILVVDILSSIPFDILAVLFGQHHFFIALRLLRLVRIIKIYNLIENITIVPPLFRMQAVTFFFLTVVNSIACGWIIIYPRPEALDVTTYYIRSFYWALATLTTIGYGDITPTDNIGMIYTCFVMVTGVAMYGVVIGNITRLMALRDRYKEQTREKMSDLMQFLSHYNIPSELQEAAINHYNHIFSKRLSENDEKIISELPHALQHEMQLFMKIKLIANIPIFKDCSHECLKEVSKNLTQVYTSPGEKIISVGEVGKEMYIISHGTVEVNLASGDIVALLHDGQIFGEMSLLKESTRNANIVSQTYCDLYKLTQESFLDITKNHPALFQNIEKLTHKRASDRKV